MREAVFVSYARTGLAKSARGGFNMTPTMTMAAHAINAAVDKLTQASHKLAEAMYKATAEGQAAPGPDGAGPSADGAPGGESEKKDEDVVDAEFEEVKDNKKSA